MNIDLNNVEQQLARYVARKRYEYVRKNGVPITLYGTKEAQDVIGNYAEAIGAELAYCKANNIYPDLDVEAYPPYDALKKDGATVDIKVTARENGRLLVKVKDRTGLPDYYVLMVGKFPSYRIAGHIPAKEVVDETRIDRSLPYPAYAIDQRELN